MIRSQASACSEHAISTRVSLRTGAGRKLACKDAETCFAQEAFGVRLCKVPVARTAVLAPGHGGPLSSPRPFSQRNPAGTSQRAMAMRVCVRNTFITFDEGGHVLNFFRAKGSGRDEAREEGIWGLGGWPRLIVFVSKQQDGSTALPSQVAAACFREGSAGTHNAYASHTYFLSLYITLSHFSWLCLSAYGHLSLLLTCQPMALLTTSTTKCLATGETTNFERQVTSRGSLPRPRLVRGRWSAPPRAGRTPGGVGMKTSWGALSSVDFMAKSAKQFTNIVLFLWVLVNHHVWRGQQPPLYL